jgi:predicted CoA-substrate-specific enzyme activase
VLRWADKDLTEIACHARGANRLFPQVKTVIDVGGQDSKIVQVDENGNVTDFMMNDKCAAGTGRFLEMMASTLGITMEEFAAAGQD